MHARRLLAVAVIATIVAVPAAQAHSGTGNDWITVASGLDNPRGIALGSHGDLWISEAGKGGTAPCFPGEEGGASCFGNTGAFTLVHHGVQKRVVEGLPSIADEGTGDAATGAHDIIVSGNHVTGLIGSGGNPEQRGSVPEAALFGWVVKVNPWKGTVTPFADVLQYEADHDPDGTGIIDSDGYGLTKTHGGFIVADAAGNDVLGVSYHKQISTLAVFPITEALAPPFLGLPPGSKIPMEAVPTSTAVRPHDPNIYVGQLTGFPFPVGAASVFRIKPDGTTDVYATGFTNITDIAWGKHGALYVVEIAQNGLLDETDQTGAIVKVWPNGKQETVASTGLTNPTAIAIAKDGTVYVTNHGASAGIGEVLNIGKV
jgi:hypothetical protein